MADYSSYKIVSADEIENNTITDADIDNNALNTFGVKWVYGSPGPCSPGCCCRWTVPSCVSRVTFELWGSGGNGSGMCVHQRCQHFSGAMGGSHNTKTISTRGGCAYTVCAAGVYRCYSRECLSNDGCPSYVNGYNLSSFCACGGIRACTNGNQWCQACYAQNSYCRQPGDNNGDFYIVPMHPGWSAAGSSTYCHCHNQTMWPGGAAGIGTTMQQGIRECWVRCGCWSAPYGAGGQSAMNTYCGNSCCGQGGTGGAGLVRITYI